MKPKDFLHNEPEKSFFFHVTFKGPFLLLHIASHNKNIIKMWNYYDVKLHKKFISSLHEAESAENSLSWFHNPFTEFLRALVTTIFWKLINKYPQ